MVHRRRYKSALSLAGLVIIAPLIGACAPSELDDAPIVGSRLSEIVGDDDHVWLIYDLSSPILDLEPTYNGGSAMDRWVVVAACQDGSNELSRSVAVGVIPKDNYKPVSKIALDGGFNSLLEECS